MNQSEFKTGRTKGKTKSIFALKDHVLFSPPSIKKPITIKKGDDLTKILEKIPVVFHQSLITEGVMKGK